MVREFYFGYCLIKRKKSGYPDDRGAIPHRLLSFGRTELSQ